MQHNNSEGYHGNNNTYMYMQAIKKTSSVKQVNAYQASAACLLWSSYQIAPYIIFLNSQ